MDGTPKELYDKIFDYHMYKLRQKHPKLSPSYLADKAHDLTRKEIRDYNENDDATRILNSGLKNE